VIGIIGTKLGMTQIFNEQGQQIPVTVVHAAPNRVTKVTDAGHKAVELATGSLTTAQQKGKRTPRGYRAPKAMIGHGKVAGLEAAPAVVRSFRLDDGKPGAEAPAVAVGQDITVEIFAPGEVVKVTGTSKGRGFQGMVKRHHAGGGPNTHGNTKHRRPGSIGAGTDPSRVIKGKRMPGHLGAARHTQINLRIEKVDAERNLIYIRGAVAGPNNGIVLVRKQA
jgi:large subunit ribosomal protein L3